jgi:AcrR family transcriptional regulator
MDDLFILSDNRPTRSDALRNRDLLLESARRLIAAHGADALSMSAVAEAAGVGKGTLYRHFRDKTQLFEALVDVDQRALQENTLARLRAVPGQPADNLAWFLGEALGFVLRNLNLLAAEGVTRLSAGPSHPAHMWWLQTIRGLMSRLHPPMDVQYAAQVVYLLLDPCMVAYLRAQPGFDEVRLREGLLEAAGQLCGVRLLGR